MFFASHTKKILLKGIVLMLFMFLYACSSNTPEHPSSKESEGSGTQASSDRFEKLNRKIYKVNVAFDKHLFKPVAKAYKKIMPEPVDTSISNFFLNLGDIGNAANNLLQFKAGDALKDTQRFIFNSTFGIGGLFDIATEMGLEKHHEDFGQTLAVWGVDSGPYIMLPFFGPSTLRDATAKFSIDFLLDPTIYSDQRYALFALKKLDERADLLTEEAALEDLSDDQYIALRDAWLQRRDYLIHDGKQDEKQQSDLIDELEDLDND